MLKTHGFHTLPLQLTALYRKMSSNDMKKTQKDTKKARRRETHNGHIYSAFCFTFSLIYCLRMFGDLVHKKNYGEIFYIKLCSIAINCPKWKKKTLSSCLVPRLKEQLKKWFSTVLQTNSLNNLNSRRVCSSHTCLAHILCFLVAHFAANHPPGMHGLKKLH